MSLVWPLLLQRKSIGTLALAASLSVGGIGIGRAADDSRDQEIGSGNGIGWSAPDGNNSINLSFWGQVRFQMLDRDLYRRASAVQLTPPFEVENIGDRVTSFRVRRLRLIAKGNLYRPWVKYKIEADLVSSESGLKSVFIPANDPILGFAGINVTASDKDQDGRTVKLMDGYIDFVKSRYAGVRLGQFKVPFGRQEQVSDSQLQMIDRSIASDAFTLGRDRGAMFHGSSEEGRIGYAIGVFNGVGFNQAENLDNSLGYAARLTVTSRGDYLDIDSLRDAPEKFHLQGGFDWYTSNDRPLRDSAATPFGDIRDTRQAAHIEAFWPRFNLIGEFYTRTIDVDFPFDLPRSCFAAFFLGRSNCDQRGFNFQAGALLGKNSELAIRYARVDSDIDVDQDERKEAAINYTLFLNKHALKWMTTVSFFDIGVNAAGSSGFNVQLGVAPSSGVGSAHFLIAEPNAFPGLKNDKNTLITTQVQFAF